MVRDIEGQGDEEAALEWGVEFDLDEGETLPDDVEDLTEAQYAIFKFMKTLQGVFEDAEVGSIRGETPSRLIVPNT